MKRVRLFAMVALLGASACATLTAGGSVDPAEPVTGPPSGGRGGMPNPPATGPSGSVSDFDLNR